MQRRKGRKQFSLAEGHSPMGDLVLGVKIRFASWRLCDFALNSLRLFALIMVAAGSCVSAEEIQPALPALRVNTNEQIYTGDHLTAIDFPVGGLGTGTLFVDGFGQWHSCYLWDTYAAKTNPLRGFLVSWQPGEWHALQGRPLGRIPGASEISFRGEYPSCEIDLSDSSWAVEAKISSWNPFVPFNERDSAIPCAITKIHLRNTGPRAVNLKLRAVQENLLDMLPGQGAACSNELARGGAGPTIHLVSRRDRNDQGYGDLALTSTSPSQPYDDLARSEPDLAGLLRTNLLPTGGPIAALDVPLTLLPGQTSETTFILTWSFPNQRKHWGTVSFTNYWSGHASNNWKTTAVGNRYNFWWKDARASAREVRERLPELERETRAFHDTVYESNLPRWLLDSLTSSTAILRSPTCFWNRDGYFGALEGHRESDRIHMDGNCAHVLGYSQTHAFLFPAIARSMRESELKLMLEDGFIPHRQSGNKRHFGPAFDGQCESVLAVYRELLLSKDMSWFKKQWPRTRLAARALLKWDGEKLDGIFDEPQWTTMDDNVNGTTTWMGSLYLAALSAGEEMAKLSDDADTAALFATVQRNASATEDRLLYNGQYYIQKTWDKPKPWGQYKIPFNDAARFGTNQLAHGAVYEAGCHIDQLLGQWWSGVVGLGELYPPDHIRSALASVLRYNFHPDLSVLELDKRYFSPGQAGVQMISYPQGSPKKKALYSDQVWSGCEYDLAALLIQQGLVQEGLRVAEAVRDRYDGRLRTDWRYGEGGNPYADVEWGRFYMRSLSVWSILTACQGFRYDGPQGLIGFAPQWQPENHVSPFTYPDGFGVFAQKRDARSQICSLRLLGGKIEFQTLNFALPANEAATASSVRLNGKLVASQMTPSGVKLKEPVLLRPGDVLQAEFILPGGNGD